MAKRTDQEPAGLTMRGMEGLHVSLLFVYAICFGKQLICDLINTPQIDPSPALHEAFLAVTILVVFIIAII